MTPYDGLSLIIAVAALVLGYVNFRRLMLRDRARFYVTAREGGPDEPYQPRDHRLYIEVVNASYFPVTIKGIYLSGCLGWKLVRVNFYLLEGEPWPIRLEQGQSAEIYLARSNLQHPGDPEPNLRWLSGVTIELSTGERFRKRTGSVRSFLHRPTRQT